MSVRPVGVVLARGRTVSGRKVEEGDTYAVAGVLAGLAVGAQKRAGVHLGAAPRGAGWAVNAVGSDIAAGGEVGLGGSEAGEGRGHGEESRVNHVCCGWVCRERTLGVWVEDVGMFGGGRRVREASLFNAVACRLQVEGAPSQ